jgi:hypothetical protein
MSTRISMHRSRLFPALHTLVASGALVAVPACVPEDAPLDLAAFDDLDLTPISPAGDQWNDCSTWDCNKNHPQLTGFPVPELHEGGESNEQQFRIVSFQKGATTYQLDVTGGEIRGLDAGGTPLLLGPAVIDGIITVTNGLRTWYIQIADYTYALQYWDGTGQIPAYHLVYWRGNIDGHPVWDDVCKEPPSPGTEPGWPVGYETYALLIDDERYDRKTIEVKDDDADAQGWFNIACAGTALAKMVLLHLDPKIPAPTSTMPSLYYTTKAQRTATLKMLTGDYFGTGYSFTEGGQDLWWTSKMGWHPLVLPQNPDDPEAIWTDTGARCLTIPRLLDEYPGDNGEPSIAEQIEVYRQDHGLPELLPCDDPSVPLPWDTDDVWYTFNVN